MDMKQTHLIPPYIDYKESARQIHGNTRSGLLVREARDDKWKDFLFPGRQGRSNLTDASAL
jgi:hypothetical protein